ncbi:MAG: HlyD family efflux transporter periplasmic adaptor subunit [Anaerolineaceae bacterium]|nr:HlyD family efflux transporter periplasmic adaptor subunit [Anaerolineaceae bacterium]
MNIRFSLMFTLFVGLFMLSACNTNNTPNETPVVYDSVQENSSGIVIADGEIVPAKDMQIISQSNGKVTELLIEEGQQVQAGQVIIRLEIPQQLIAELKSAELEQLQAQQSLDELVLYGYLQKQLAYQRVLDAQVGRNVALAVWDDFDEDKYEQDLEKLNEDMIDAKQELKDAKNDLEDFLDLEEDNALRKRRQDTLDKAQISLNQAERAYDNLEINYEQLQLNLELTKAVLDTAIAEYQKFGQSDIQREQKELAEELLSTANTQVEALQSAMNDLEITAPFNGKMVSLKIQHGEWIRVGQVVAVIVDDSSWLVESTDINEMDIVQIKIGDEVTIELDAFPGEMIRGKIIEIDEYPQSKYNDVIYPVRIQLAENNLPLRWMMSVIIKFDENK